MRFSPNLERNRISRAVDAARRGGRPLVDLTATNPNFVGIDYPRDLLAPLASPAALTYAPHPFGAPEARAAVAADYARRGVAVDPARIVLTASTSEAYSLLFKLLCAPAGDAVLVPVPSYPLFEHLTMLDGVKAIVYPLEYHGRWTVAFAEVDRVWTETVRAVLAVSPNNPTGSVLAADEVAGLSSRCAQRNAALIIDEVFADYPLAAGADSRPVMPVTRSDMEDAACLTFRLGGLSKSAGLPQVKLGWIAVDGPDDRVRDALERFEVVCDAYLSVSTPVQVAAKQLIDSGAAIRARISERIHANWRTLLAAAARYRSIDVLPIEAGWSAVLRVPSVRSEEDLVVDLIERDGVLVHPGFFFDFPCEAFVVVSLLPEAGLFERGIEAVMERAHA